ncbi:alpha-xenorhabdolysin family binary toxin subunit B [Pseudomonas sp. A-R-19]|uniref:alpha-xenorhabdolysin family binary toxin subunit B n=1 Tax=Pseudomonas sp. A-R-19 TaxID=2832403 RepID=UPI001CC0A781|nr:alpha-xenorhabdolysin family binary toxin subunit B [Pseudomonas sp. A-R-19]
MNMDGAVMTHEQRMPDYSLMKANKKAINKIVAQLNLDFSDYLKAKLGRLDHAINDTHANIFGVAVAVMPMLREANFKSFMIEFQRLSNEPDLSGDLRMKTLEGLKADYIKSVNADAGKIRGFALAVNAHLISLDDIDILGEGQSDSSILLGFDEDIVKALSDLDRRLEEVEVQCRILDDLISVIDDKNLIDHLLPWIPDGNFFKSFEISAPQAELVKKGLELLRKLLEQASEYIRYTEMVRARDGLRIKRAHYFEQKNEYQKLQADHEIRVDTLRQVKSIEGLKVDYLYEANTFLRNINNYASLFDLAPQTTIDNLKVITDAAVSLSKTLEPIASAWRT